MPCHTRGKPKHPTSLFILLQSGNVCVSKASTVEINNLMSCNYKKMPPIFILWFNMCCALVG